MLKSSKSYILILLFLFGLITTYYPLFGFPISDIDTIRDTKQNKKDRIKNELRISSILMNKSFKTHLFKR